MIADRTSQFLATEPAPELPVCPARAHGVQLLQELPDSAFTQRQWLVQRGERFIQLSELLYRVLEQADGTRTLEQIAAVLTQTTEWQVSTQHVRHMLWTKLLPLGLIGVAGASEVARARDQRRSALQVNLRRRLVGPEVLNPLAGVLGFLYRPPILLAALVAILLGHGWLYFVHGVGDSLRAALYTPGLLLVVLATLLAASLFHELGHAAGLRYGGGTVRGIGAGFYLLYPVFYTDVTDGYRLRRWARVRTDLGGFYFHLLFALGLMALYWVTGLEFLLAVVLVIDLDIALQCLPYVRLDGYWALADLTGIPDFFSQIGPLLRSLLPAARVKGERLPPLRPWARVMFLVYALVAVSMLGAIFLQLLLTVPLIVTTAWDSALAQGTLFAQARAEGNGPAMASVLAQLSMLALPLLGSTYLLYRLGLTPIRVVWQWSRSSATRRVVGGAAALGVLGVLGLVWAPQLPFLASPELAGVERFDITQRSHVTGSVAYAQSPPVGGDHAPIWQNCGFYAEPIGNEYAVHSMEHGAVWITFRPDLAGEQIEQLRRLADGRSYVLVSAYPGLPSPVVASAWGRQLHLTSADDPQLDQFIRTYHLGRQAPERGGPCTGGVGRPA